MKLYIEGNYDAFEILYQRHSPKIYGYLVKRLTSSYDANEVFQEVFGKLHAFRNKYKPKYPFLPWIFTITRNALIDHFRKKGKEFFDSAEMDKYPASQKEENMEALKEFPGMEGLNPREKDAIEMKYEKDFSFKEIAEILETSDSNIRKIISRGIQKLRKKA